MIAPAYDLPASEGTNTSEVLREMGLDQAEIEALERDGVVA